MKTTVDVYVALFAFSGSGGVAAIVPPIAMWLAETTVKASKDPRVGRFATKVYGGIPLTAERNKVVLAAKQGGFDIILMIDSDNIVDLLVGHKEWAKPFWDTAFEFAFARLLRGLPSVVAAPYTGPPPHPITGGESNVYNFYFQGRETNPDNMDYRLQAYSREHASQMRGIQELAAGPTGCILYTTNAFDLMQFDRRRIEDILSEVKHGTMTIEKCARELRKQSWFYYEFSDQTCSTMCSTEDVVNLREIAMAGHLKFGEPVVFCAWDCWAGHAKPTVQGYPEPIRMEHISATYTEAVLAKVSATDERRDVDFTASLPKRVVTAASQIDDVPQQTETSSGVPIKYRMICGRKMASVGHVTPDHHLNALTLLTQQLSQSLKRPMRMLEVGSWVGESAVALLGGTLPGSEIYCVDTWEGSASDWTGHLATQESPMDWFVKNCGELIGESVRPVKGLSIEVADSFGDSQQLDLIFLDGDHAYESVKADIEHWQYHLANGGILCGHDYCEAFPGVIQAVDEYCEAELIPGTTIWYAIQTSTDARNPPRHHPV